MNKIAHIKKRKKYLYVIFPFTRLSESDGNNEIVIPGMFPSESAESPSYFHFTSDTYRSAAESPFETP